MPRAGRRLGLVGLAGLGFWKWVGSGLWAISCPLPVWSPGTRLPLFTLSSPGAFAGLARAGTAGGFGFSSVLRLVGLGFKCWRLGSFLFLDLGKTHYFRIPIPAGVYTLFRRKRGLIFFGLDVRAVYRTSLLVRGCYPPDTYKGKGVRFRDEPLRLKPGKQR
jgi:large subunit ribosomal protein L6